MRRCSTVPGTQTHRVAVLASTISGRAPPAACPKASAAPSSRARSPFGSSLQITAAVWSPVNAYPSRPSARCRAMGAPSRISATVSRRSACVPRVSSSRSRSIWAAMADRVVSTNALIDREHTSRNSCNSAGSEVSSNAISMRRRQATPSPTRYASSENASSPLRTNSRATVIGSGPVFGGTGAPGSRTLAVAQKNRLAWLLRLTAAASSGSAAIVGLAPSTALSSSSSHSGRCIDDDLRSLPNQVPDPRRRASPRHRTTIDRWCKMHQESLKLRRFVLG